LKHEVGGEPFEITLNGFIEASGWNPVKLRQIGIENDFLTAKLVDECGELFRHEQGSGC